MADYYAILGISHEAQADDIAKAYRRAALTYNPACNPDAPGQQELARRFKLVSQAYVVLSDQTIRAVYDAYGESGVRHGGTGKVGIPGGVAVEKTDPDAVFRQFFGVDNPFQVLGDISGVQNTQHNFYSSSAAVDKNPPKTAPVNVVLEVTLEDIFFGAVRNVTWTNTYTTAGDTVTSTPASFEFPVAKNVVDGSVVTLAGKGATKEGSTQGDVRVTICVLKHDKYQRTGDDLIVTVPISIADALTGVSVVVDSIEGRALQVLIDEVVHPNFQKRLVGEGMPKAADPAARGDLVVECATVFPTYLTAEQKSELRRILSSS
jgi:DnaJ family protein B protein 4